VRYGLGHGALVWLFAFGIPAFFALWTIMLFNFIQHVHTDPWSEHNHSRNFTSRTMNYLLFNNALHTPHHEMAGAHWSTLWEAFETIKPEIHPELRTRSFFWWLFRCYVLSPLFPSMGTKQIGRAAYEPPPSEQMPAGASAA
jgi:fatty acid desaturase